MEAIEVFLSVRGEINKVNGQLHSTIAQLDNTILSMRRRRRQFMKSMNNLRKMQHLILMAQIEEVPRPRLEWQRTRTQLFWEKDCTFLNEQQFKDNFKMNRETFNKLCRALRTLKKHNSQFRESISLDKRIAVAIYTLASSSEYRTIANLFGIGTSTVCSIFLEFCEEVWKQLSPSQMCHFPLKEDKICELLSGFEKLGFPQCIGAIDGCHIEVKPRAEDAPDHYNYKGWYSTVLLALVDYRYRFLYVNVGAPGRCSDSQLYEKSQLKPQLSTPVLEKFTKSILNVDVPINIIGDSAFRFSKHLMKPYPFSITRTEEQNNFNKSLSKCRRVVENAFGHLKARFRRIGKGIDNDIGNANKIIRACCVLHNFLNENNDAINDNWLVEQRLIDQQRQQPDLTVLVDDLRADAEEIRSSLARFLCEFIIWNLAFCRTSSV